MNIYHRDRKVWCHTLLSPLVRVIGDTLITEAKRRTQQIYLAKVSQDVRIFRSKHQETCGKLLLNLGLVEKGQFLRTVTGPKKYNSG